MLLAALLSAVMVPFLLPAMHERFFILGDVLAFVYAVAYPSRRSIAAAALIQVASTFPVLAYAFAMYPAHLIAAPVMLFAIVILLGELDKPLVLRASLGRVG